MEKTLFFFLLGILILPEVSSIALHTNERKKFGRMRFSDDVKIEAVSACPAGWTKLNTNCYFMPNMYLSFDDARAYCENVTTGQLVTINNEDEYNVVLSE